MDLEDVSCAGSQGLEHETGDCFVSFAVFYDLGEIGASLDYL